MNAMIKCHAVVIECGPAVNHHIYICGMNPIDCICSISRTVSIRYFQAVPVKSSKPVCRWESRVSIYCFCLPVAGHDLVLPPVNIERLVWTLFTYSFAYLST